MKPFRFGVSARRRGPLATWAELARRAGTLGFDTLLLADHLGHPDPFLPLVAAAAASPGLRVGTFVLNNDFHHPVLLARTVETLVELTGPRVEIGLGAGHMKSEYDVARIPFEPLPRRVERLAATLTELRARLDPCPPLLVGGTSRPLLRLAAEQADIVGISGTRQVPGRSPGTLRIITAEDAAGCVATVLGAAPRDIELNALVQAVIVTDDRRGAAERLAAGAIPYMSPEQILANPFLLVGTHEEIATSLQRHRERLGITYWVVFEDAMEALAPVIALLGR